MRPRRLRASLTALATGLAWLPAAAVTTAAVSISIKGGNDRAGPIPEDFLGISLESSAIAAANNGGREWLSGTSGAFSTMMKRIGVKSVRIGGNSAERTGYPTLADARSVGDFADLVGANLLWVLPVKNNTYDNAASASTATAMFDDQKAKGYTFRTTYLIGNEPDIDMAANGSNPDDPPIPYSTWRYRFDRYDTLLRAHDDSITSSGPSAAGDRSYATQFAQDPTYSGPLQYSVGYVTEHTYPLGASNADGPNSQEAITKFLQDNSAKYQSFYDSWAAGAAARGFKTRVDETNSMYHAVTDQPLSGEYASALWVLDYLSYMAYHTQLGGMDIHSGPVGSAGYAVVTPIGAAASYTLRPIGYGMFAFATDGRGKPMTAKITSNTSGVNLSAYALKESDGSASAHILNKTHGSGAVDATVKIRFAGHAHCDVMYLKQANSDVTAADGITLGGAPVNADGSWNGGYTLTGISAVDGVFKITVPHTQAAIVHFHD
jgi:hypothetical protein